MAGIGNTSALVGSRVFGAQIAARDASMLKLSTGLRINRGADDPAGLISSEQLRAVLAQLEAETRVLQRSDAVVNTADGALGEISDMLVEAEALEVANANTAGMSDAEIEANEMQLASIRQSIDRIASTTTFNGDKLLDGSAEINVAGETLTIANASVGGQLTDAASIRAAASQIATLRGELGSFSKNIIAPALSNNAVAFENVASAESQIRDTDFAAQTAILARTQVLADSSAFALGLSNSQSRTVLDLLG
ncbi:MAG: flagellin [Planctomycetota bacterium]